MQVEVTQADREAAASVYASEGNDYDAALVPGGGCDHWPIVEAFARHRLAERAKIVAWLREQDGHGYDDMRANCIEAGEHYNG